MRNAAQISHRTQLALGSIFRPCTVVVMSYTQMRTRHRSFGVFVCEDSLRGNHEARKRYGPQAMQLAPSE